MSPYKDAKKTAVYLCFFNRCKVFTRHRPVANSFFYREGKKNGKP
jgi:hypothetical protein